MYIILNSIVCVCAFVGFIYGIIKFFKPKKALFAQMITLGVGCMAFGRLFQVVRLMTGGDIFGRFQLGMMGIIGSLLFLFSASFGLMDSLADDGSKQFRKYRIIPLAAPLTALAVYVIFVLFADLSLLSKVFGAVLTFFVMETTYFNLKHLIFPDVDYGIINCLKLYNVTVLIYSFLCLFELIVISNRLEILTSVASVLMGLLLLAVIPTVERGIKKWTT